MCFASCRMWWVGGAVVTAAVALAVARPDLAKQWMNNARVRLLEDQ